MQENFVRVSENVGEKKNSRASFSLAKPLLWVLIVSSIALNFVFYFMWNTQMQKNLDNEKLFMDLKSQLTLLSETDAGQKDQFREIVVKLNKALEPQTMQLSEDEARSQAQNIENEAQFKALESMEAKIEAENMGLMEQPKQQREQAGVG